MNRNVFLRKLGGRLVRTLSISFWVMVISYSLIRLSPGDPAEARLGAGADPAALLADDDSHGALSLAGDLFRTEATSTNVADVVMAIAGYR